MNQIQLEDCRRIGNLEYIQWEKLKNSSFLITGSTGIIGNNLVNALTYNSRNKGLNIKFFLPVRDVNKAEKLFGKNDVEIFQYKLGTFLNLTTNVDYIIHLASPTSSKYFVEKPADTLCENIEGTKAILDWGKQHNAKKIIVLSSMEVYGFPLRNHSVKEYEIGAFETMNARNSYPISKIACEALCYSYFTQYNVPILILRLTQTFGPGISYQDGRVFAQFMRSVIENKDIILYSKGSSERSYLYTSDAVSAIILGILDGKNGEAYTVANPDTYCSILEMAQMVVNSIADKKIAIQICTTDSNNSGYAPTLYMNLDVSKIKALGWYPTVGLHEMYKRMIDSIKEDISQNEVKNIE